MSDVLLAQSPSTAASPLMDDSREVTTISPSNPLDVDSSAPNTPVNASSSSSQSSTASTDSTQSLTSISSASTTASSTSHNSGNSSVNSGTSTANGSVIDRLSRLRGVIGSRLTDEKSDPNPWTNTYKQEAAAAHAAQQAQKEKEALAAVAAAAAKLTTTPAMLRIGFGSSNSLSPSPFQPVPSARHSPARPLASRTPDNHSPALSATSVTHSSSTSVIQGISLSNAVPIPGASAGARSLSPSPTSQSQARLPSAVSTASNMSSSAASLINSNRPAFLKGGVGASGGGVAGKLDRTGKAKKRQPVDDEDEEEEFMGEDGKEREDDKHTLAAPSSKLTASSSSRSPTKLSVASSSGISAAGKTNRMAKLRNATAKQAKVRNSRSSAPVGNGVGAAARVVKEEDEEEHAEEGEAEAEPRFAIAISPTLNGYALDDDEREAAPESPLSIALSPRKQPPQSHRLHTLSTSSMQSASPTAASAAARSPQRSSTPDPTKKRKPSTARSTSPLPVPSSPSAPAISPSPQPIPNSCARLRPWTNPHKVLVGNPCEKDMWKGSRRGDEEDSDSDSSDDEAERRQGQRHLRAGQDLRQQTGSPAIFALPSPQHSRATPSTGPVSPSAGPPSPPPVLTPIDPSATETLAETMPFLEQVDATAEPAGAAETASIPPPLPPTRRQSGRGHNKIKSEQPTLPPVQEKHEEETAMAMEPAVAETGKAARGRKSPTATVKPKAAPKGRARKRNVLLDDDGDEEMAPAEDKAVQQQQEQKEPEKETATASDYAAPIATETPEKSKPAPVNTVATSTPTANALLAPSPLSSPRVRQKRRRTEADMLQESPEVQQVIREQLMLQESTNALPSATTPPSASPVIASRSKRTKATADAEAIATAAAVPAPPPFRRTRSSSHSAIQPPPPVTPPAAPSAEDSSAKKGKKGSKAQQGTATPSESVNTNAFQPTTVKTEPKVEVDARTESQGDRQQAAEPQDADNTKSNQQKDSGKPDAEQGAGGKKEAAADERTTAPSTSASSPRASSTTDDGKKGKDSEQRESVGRPDDRDRARDDRDRHERDRDRDRDRERERRDDRGERRRDDDRDAPLDRDRAARRVDGQSARSSRDRSRERENDRDRAGRDRDARRDREGRDSRDNSLERDRRDRERDRDRDRDYVERRDRDRDGTRSSRSPDSSGYSARDKKDRTQSFDETTGRREERRDRDRDRDREYRDERSYRDDRDRDRGERGDRSEFKDDRRQRDDKERLDRERERERERRSRDDDTRPSPRERADRDRKDSPPDDEQYDGRRKNSDQLSLSHNLSPVPISPASNPPTAPTLTTSSQEDVYQSMATQLKHRADAMKGSGLSADGQRERAFVYTVAGVLFFLSTHKKASTAQPVTSSPSAASTSYKPILEFLTTVSQTVTEAPDLPVLLQLFQRVKAIVALQQSYTLLDSPALKKSKTKESKRCLAELKEQTKAKASLTPLTAQSIGDITAAVEAAEWHVAAREGWVAARKLSILFAANEQPAVYGLRVEAVELNAVGVVMEYVRRTLREVVDKRKVVLSQFVQLDAIDPEWKS